MGLALDLVQGWFMSVLNEFFYSSMISFIEVFGSFINNIFDLVNRANETIGLDTLSSYTVELALAYVGMKAVQQGLNVYVFETEGDPDSDPLELITRTAQACAVIYCGSFFVDTLIKISGLISSKVLKLVNGATGIAGDSDNGIQSSFTNLLDTLYNGSTYKGKAIGFVLIFICVFILVALIIFIFQAGKRGAELSAFRLLLPLLATDLLTTNREKWNQFFTEMMLCIFGYILQIASFNIFLFMLAKTTGSITESFDYLVAAIGWLILVLSAPKWMSKFMYTSGIGNGAKGGVRTATYVIPQLIRK